MLFDGLHIPLTTPFYPDGRVYLRKLEHNVDRYSRTPASGLVLLTRTGERTLLSDDESRQVLSTAVAASAPEKVLIADVSRDSVRSTVELAEFAANLNYDAVALRLPELLAGGDGSTLDPQARLTYLQTIADRSPLPILLEDSGLLSLEMLTGLSANPAFPGLALGEASTEDTITRLREVRAATANASQEVVVTTIFAAVTRRMRAPLEPASGGNYIAANSLAGGSTALATAAPAPALRTRTKRVGFQLLTRNTASLAASLEAGASGSVLPFAVCAPQAVYEVHAAWKDGDPALAAEKQQRLLSAAAEIEQHLGIAALKVGCDLNGYYGGKPRLPLLPLSGEQRSRVEAIMAGMRN